MLTDLDIEYKHVPGIWGHALAWIIDEDCVHALPLNKEYAEMFTSYNDITDVSNQYPDHDGITVRLVKDNVIINDFQTSEYFGSILLSNPLVVSLHDYPYGIYVEPNHAKFVNNEFIITNRDMDGVDPYPYGQIKPGDSI
jgi:hypothetical protein